MSRDAEVIVVGGGPAGAATAYRLARLGVDVMLVDRARFPRAKPCAEYLSPEAVRELDAIGALGAVEGAGGARLSGMKVRAPDGTEFGARFGGLGVARVELDARLLAHARAAGVRVVEGLRVDAVRHRETGNGENRDTGNGGERGRRIGQTRVSGIEAIDASGTRHLSRSRVVIGADGLRSVVARSLGLAKRSRSPERYAIVGHLSGVQGVTDQVEMHVTARGYVGIADIGGGLTSVAMVVPAALIGAARNGAGAFLRNWLGSHPHLAPRFAAALQRSVVQATGPFASRARRAWAPGAALVGDAAGFFDPITGQGVASALRGASLLAPFVAAAARASSDAEADVSLSAYARAHRDAFRSQWLIDELIAFFVAHPSLMDHAARALRAREGLADLLLGVTSGSRPSHDVLRPRFLFDLLRPVTR
jgi:flavin-dependent dehydrogenase